MTTIPCPHCQKAVNISEKTAYRPFCSERCRLIDLGAWASEDYQIAGKTPSEENGELNASSEEAIDWENADQLH